MKNLLNEGPADRIIRVIVGVALIVLGLLGIAGGAWMWAAYVLGAILVVTGLTGFCPLYGLLKINTVRKN